MKFKNITISSNGTTAGTKVTIDGKQIEKIQRLEFSGDVKNTFCIANIQIASTDKDGKIKTKKIKVRNEKTEKYEFQDEVCTEQLLLEREEEKK